MKTLGKVIAIILGALILLVGALQIAVNLSAVSRKVCEAASEASGGSLTVSRLHISFIRDFPTVRVTADSIRFELPEVVSADLDHLELSSNPWTYILSRSISADASLSGLLSVPGIIEAPGVPLGLELSAGYVDDDGVMTVSVPSLSLRAPGSSIGASCSASDLTGDDPHFDIGLVSHLALDSLLGYAPRSFDIDARGSLDVSLDAGAFLSEILDGKFRQAKVGGTLRSDSLFLKMASDTLLAVVRRPELQFVSGSDGLDVTVSSDRIFFRKGENRVGLSDVDLGASIHKKTRSRRAPRHHLDSLPQGRPEDELSYADIDFGVDSTILAYLRDWEPAGSVSAGRGFFSTPAIPLRTSLSAVKARFTGNEINLDTLKLRVGRSDLSANGSVRGVGRALRGKGVLEAGLGIRSSRLNVNEILLALQHGKDSAPLDSLSEDEGSFVLDSIAGTDVAGTSLPLIIVPGNIDASVRIRADRVIYSDIRIRDFSTLIKMKGRTLQVADASASTNLGQAALDAFYSTRSKSDISAGLGLKLRNVSASDIIHMLPAVDDMMPALKSFEGNLALDLSATARIDSLMNVQMPSLDAILRIGGSDLYIRDAGSLKRITRLLLFRDKNIGHIEDLSVDAVVHDSKLEVFPFELAVDRYKLALRGEQGLDGRMNYHISVMKSPFLIPFGINIYGYPDNWRFSLGFAKYRQGRVPVYTQQLESIQLNLVQSIRDVYRRGVDNARKAARRRPDPSSDEALDIDPSDGEELSRHDEMSYDLAASLAQEELDEEVEEALSENVIDLGSLLREYEVLNENKRIDSLIDKLKK